MCNCARMTCFECRTDIEGFFQEKVKEAKETVAFLKTQGAEMCYEDLLDAKWIRWEFEGLHAQELADDSLDQEIPDETYQLKDSWL